MSGSIYSVEMEHTVIECFQMAGILQWLEYCSALLKQIQERSGKPNYQVYTPYGAST